MGRLSAEEKAKREAALLNENNGDPNGAASYAGQPQPNTTEGIIEKENATQAGVNPSGDGSEPKDLTDINGTNEETPDPKTLLATQEDLDKNPYLVEIGVKVGDTQESAKEKHEAHQAFLATLVKQEDLDNNELYQNAGVAVGDNPEVLAEKLKAYEDAQATLNKSQETDNSDKAPRKEDGTIDWEKTGVQLLDNGNIKINGEEFTIEIAEAIMQYAKIIDGKVTVSPDLWAQMVEQSAIKPPVENNNPENKNDYVYHGDFLNEEQANRPDIKLAFSWDEVTAPEHEQFKPAQ